MNDTQSRAGTLRDARRRLCEHGDVGDAGLAPVLQRSWRRSLEAGLSPRGRNDGTPHASAAQLMRAMQRHYELLAHARPVMEYMAGHIRDTGAVIILADAQGLLLEVLGDPSFAGRAARIALRPGASWQERWRGTNAIGTALADGRACVVRGAEHFLARNAFLSCAAAPILDPRGRLLGAIDMSCDRRAYHPHTAGLVHTAARMIERRLFDVWHADTPHLRFHARAEGLSTLDEGLLALGEDGSVIGANAVARDLLGIGGDAGRGWRLDDVFVDDGGDALAALARGSVRRPQPLRRPDGSRWWGRLDGLGAAGVPVRASSVASAPRVATGSSSPSSPWQDGDGPFRPGHPPVAPAAVRDALDALDTGDATLRAVIDRVRRVLGKPIALLLQGESGTGKDVFARAVHASGPRRDGPFVAVNCAALPETLIEAELFGYGPGAFTGARRDGAPGRLREATGGTLFLDEIGDMPAPMQARLLRVLQERVVVPLGGGRPVPVDFALVCATHRHLRAAIADGTFREDLYYRLNGLVVTLPALRARDDFDMLLDRMLADAGAPAGVVVDAALRASLRAHRWPGNLRQLANALRTAVALLGPLDDRIGRSHLPDDLLAELDEAGGTASAPIYGGRPAAADRADEPMPQDLRSLQAMAVARMVDVCGGNLSEAARRLGITRHTLYRRLGR